jgi:AcrR family transcriptional regulator
MGGMTEPSGGTPDASGGTPEGRRVLQLLWDPPGPPARGPRPKLTLPAIVSAGIELAGSEGLDALSMRKVAQRLNAGVMSLYTYVPGRSELVELMINHAYGELAKADPALPWRDQLLFLANQHVDLFRRHPWILDTSLWRLPMGPNVLDAEEELYRALAASGLTPAQITGVKNLILWHVHGVAWTDIQDREEARRTGVSTEAYWESRNSFWYTYFEPARFPTMSWIHENGGFDDALVQNFDFTFHRVLDGIELLVASSPPRAAGEPSASCSTSDPGS